jgi:hypothetical protein
MNFSPVLWPLEFGSHQKGAYLSAVSPIRFTLLIAEVRKFLSFFTEYTPLFKTYAA